MITKGIPVECFQVGAKVRLSRRPVYAHNAPHTSEKETIKKIRKVTRNEGTKRIVLTFHDGVKVGCGYAKRGAVYGCTGGGMKHRTSYDVVDVEPCD